MPQDSYVLDYFKSLNTYLSVGSPIYFVVQDGHDYTTKEGQNQICSGQGCPENSMLGYVYKASLQPNRYQTDQVLGPYPMRYEILCVYPCINKEYFFQKLTQSCI